MHQAQTFAAVTGRLKGVVHTAVMDEQRKDGAIEFRSGTLDIASNIHMAGGSLEIYDSVNQTRLLVSSMMMVMQITRVYYSGMLVLLLVVTSSYSVVRIQKTLLKVQIRILLRSLLTT